jgi:hypothetical protein
VRVRVRVRVRVKERDNSRRKGKEEYLAFGDCEEWIQSSLHGRGLGFLQLLNGVHHSFLIKSLLIHHEFLESFHIWVSPFELIPKYM